MMSTMVAVIFSFSYLVFIIICSYFKFHSFIFSLVLSIIGIILVFLFENYQRIEFIRLKKQAKWTLVYIIGLVSILVLKLINIAYNYIRTKYS
jgi:hypothetical protein